MDKNYTFEKDIDKDQNVTLKVKIASTKFKEEKEKVYNKLAKNIEITGFRTGKAPRAMIEARLGPDLFEKTLNELLPKTTIEILADEKIDPLNQVRYEVQKVGDDEGVEFHAHFVMYPVIKLGNFKKIKIKAEKVEIKDEEMDTEMQRVLDIYNQQQATVKGKDGKVGEATEAAVKATEMTEEILKDMKIGITSLEDLKKQIKEQLTFEKERVAAEKKNKAVMDDAIKLSKINAPKVLVDQEIQRREVDYTSRIEKLGLKLEDFLKTQKTTLEELNKTWEQESKERVSSELLMYEIIRIQELKVSDDDIQVEIDKITDENLKKDYDSVNGRRTISTILLQQKAIQWLLGEIKQ